jgi:hypothetical protein
MTGIEALIALRENKKVKRKHWRDGEYLATYVTRDGCKIAPSPKYNQYRGEDLHHLEDTVLLTDEMLDDFLMDDWEILDEII